MFRVCRDLTQMFGAGNEPATAEEFEALYAPSYDTINPGTLISNDAEAVVTTGANQWDEEWESGAIYTSSGTPYIDATRIRSTNYIPVLPQTLYTHNGAHELLIVFFDKDYNILQYVPGAGATAPVVNKGADAYVGSTIFNTPDNCAYIKFTAVNSPTYNHDICINLSNAAINGQYFPYWKRTLQLGLTTKEDTDGNVPFADGMKGARTAADWADKVGGEKRMGRVDLGSLGWVARGGDIFSTTLTNVKYNGICAKYTILYSGTPSSAGDKTLSMVSYYAYGGIYIKDSAFDGYTGAQVAEALSGVYLDYELATPVPFTWAEPLNLGVKVDENGTEKAVAPEGATAPSAPFVADTTYTMSIARMVAKLNTI